MIVLRFLALIASVALIVPGSAGAKSGSSTVLRIASVIEPGTLNPVIGTVLTESDVSSMVFDGLIRVDQHGRPTPDLATAVPTRANGLISRDGKTYTYHLARGARWHDGQPVTADDVIFTWHALMNPKNNVGNRFGYDRIAEITAPDPSTVRIRFKEVYAPAVYLFGGGIQGAIVPKHVLAQYDDLNRVPFSRAPIGSGPYVFKEWRHGDRLLFEANPNYFRGRPAIDRIELRIIPDTNTLLAQLRTHEIDFTSDLDPNQLAQVKRFDGVATQVVSSNGYRHLEFNTRRPPLDDARVRRALCYAFDPDLIYKKIYFGVGDRAPADQNPAGGWANPRVRYYPYDIARAQALLEEAGWKKGPDGVRVRSGQRLAVQISSVTGAHANEAIEVLLQEAWRAAGVDVSIKNFPGATLFAPIQSGGILETGKYDVALFSYFRNPDPNDEQLIGPSSLPPKGLNVSFYADPEVGRLQKAGLRTLDERARHAAYDRIQEIIIRDVPIYTLLWVPLIAGFNAKLHGVAMSPNGVSTWNIDTWTLREPRG